MNKCESCEDNKRREESYSITYQPIDCKRCFHNPLFEDRYKEKQEKNEVVNNVKT